MIDKSPVARSIPFDNSIAVLNNDPQDLQHAIEELRLEVKDSSRGFTFCQFNGNANTGRFLEFFSGIASSEAPIYTPTALEALTIVARTSAASATCTIGFYDVSPVTPVLLYTLTFTAQKQVVLDDPAGLFTLPAMGSLAIKVDSGSISKPQLYLIVKGGAA